MKLKLTLDRRKGSLWVFILISLYVIAFSFLCFRKYTAFDYHDFDLAVYAQALWNFLHGSLQSSILGIPILGNHFVPILFLIVPLYTLFPSPLTLLFLQSCLLGTGAWFVYRLGARLLDSRLAMTLTVVYLLYPSLAFVTLFEFHPVAFAVFLLLGALEAFERERLRPFLIFLLLALACQEDVSLTVAALGVYGLFRRRARVWVLVPLGLGIGWFCLSVLILMPRWNPGTINFSLLYRHLGRNPFEIFWFIFSHPLRTLSMLVEGSNRKLFILKLLVPLGGLPLLDPKSFFLALPAFLEQLLSNRERQHLLIFHYSSLLIPPLFFSMMHGLRHLLRFSWISSNRRALSFLIIGLAAVTTVVFGPLGSLGDILRDSRFDGMDQKRQELIRRIPPRASVVATFEFLPHLANRRSLYSFHRLFKGLYDLFEEHYTFPQEIDLMVIDLNDPLTLAFMEGSEGTDRKLREFLKGWEVRQSFGDLLYLEKGEGPFLIKPVEAFSHPQNIRVDIDQTFALLGLDGLSHQGRVGEPFSLTFSWRCRQTPAKPYGLLFRFLDHNKRPIFQQYHSIGYRALPTLRWKGGERFEETYRLVLPRPVRGEGSYELTLSCLDERTHQVVPFESGGTTVAALSFGQIKVGGL